MASSKKSKNPVPQNLDDAGRKQALKTAMTQIERDFGAGSIMKLGENTQMEIQAVHTGSLSLDFALGIGGVPRGRIIEIFGPESSGKTTVALHILAEVQKANGTAAFIDAEHALDPVYAKALGVNINELLVSQPDCGEDALEICEALARSGAVDAIVIDSVAALVPRQEIEGDMGQSMVGVQARMMSQAMRKLSGVISKSNCVVIFINQIREKVGVIYGNPETTPGGRALKFFASVRIDIRKTEQLKDGNDVYGNHVKCKIVKNKVAPPFRVAEFDILYGKGISLSGEVLDFAIALDIIKKSGSWFSYNGERIGQGKENIRKLLEGNPEMMAEVEAKVREMSEQARMSMDQEFEVDDEDDDDFDLRLSGDGGEDDE
ncbi:MAG: recombinase RecA [Clostridia bacterium]|nr:recombinase RecA [Clostridia bacterium]MBQ9774197.1 recombinase RecA [Clostridia bacterium]